MAKGCRFIAKRQRDRVPRPAVLGRYGKPGTAERMWFRHAQMAMLGRVEDLLDAEAVALPAGKLG